MKKVAFILYVGCVLAFSAFARAEVMMPFSRVSGFASNVQIESVALDKNNLELLIGGFLSNPCAQLPSAHLVQDFENPALLVLRLSSPVPTDVCVARTLDFSTVVNLPVTAQNSRLDLDPQGVYVIKADGSDFELQVIGADLMRVPGFISY